MSLLRDALNLGRADLRMTRLAISSACPAVPGSLADGQGDAARPRSGFPSVRLDGSLDGSFAHLLATHHRNINLQESPSVASDWRNHIALGGQS